MYVWSEFIKVYGAGFLPPTLFNYYRVKVPDWCNQHSGFSIAVLRDLYWCHQRDLASSPTSGHCGLLLKCPVTVGNHLFFCSERLWRSIWWVLTGVLPTERREFPLCFQAKARVKQGHWLIITEMEQLVKKKKSLEEPKILLKPSEPWGADPQLALAIKSD